MLNVIASSGLRLRVRPIYSPLFPRSQIYSAPFIMPRFRRRTRRYGRRPARRPRRYSRRVTRRPRMTRRSVLNLTSTKKSDVMLPTFTNYVNGALGSVGPVTYPSPSPLVPYSVSLFCPTGRTPNSTTGSTYNTRNLSHTYAKGYLEKWRLTIVGNSSWTWRRIVFEVSVTGMVNTLAATPYTNAVREDVANGFVRVVGDVALDAANLGRIQNTIFRGTVGIDWNDPLTAMIDNQVVKVHSDRTRILNPRIATTGTNVPAYTIQGKSYIRLNKSFDYFDDEDGGGGQIHSPFAAPRSTLKDVMILDYFAAASSNAANSLVFNPEGKYYWHER
uniref:Capsid protein n=1 Tax=Red panda feces-associated gemycircularvirus TaxID=2864013 RepID=A0A8K1HJJ6_9VIRU|nr:capsid protein [Red panda feces-associated gemycircularvirus]